MYSIPSPAPLARIETLIRRCEAEAGVHMTGGGNSEDELRRLEEALRRPLPEPYRLFLRRIGGGVFYLKHELFGARRVMIHDIELVPDVLSFRDWLGGVPEGLLPVHRLDGRVHDLDLEAGANAPVKRLGAAGPVYPYFTAFLEQILLP